MLRKLTEIYKKADLAYEFDPDYQTHCKLAAISAMPGFVFVPLWLLSAEAPPANELRDHFETTCRQEQVIDIAAPLIAGRQNTAAITIDTDRLEQCISAGSLAYDEDMAGIDHRLKWAAMASLLLLYFTFTQTQKAQTRYKELEEYGFFRQHGL